MKALLNAQLAMLLRIAIIAVLYAGMALGQNPHLKIQWDANPEGNVVEYQVFRSLNPDAFGNEPIAVVANSVTFFDDFDVQQGQRYYYSVRARNDFSLSSDLSASKWGEIADLNVSLPTVDTTTVTISWRTPEAYQSQVIYGTLFLDQYSPLSTNAVTDHSVTLDNLESGTTYFFSCLSLDPSGNVLASTDTTFTTLGEASQVQQEDQVVIAYPNPARLTDGQTVLFDGLLPGNSVAVFNLSGQLVWESERFERPPALRWDINRADNRALGSGVYVYIVKNDTGKRVASGRVVLIF